MKTGFYPESGSAGKIPREIIYPGLDIPLLEWWDGIYDHVFVAFQPFYWLASETDGSRVSRRFDEETEQIDRTGYDAEKAKARGVPISWEDMRVAIAPECCMHSFYMAGWLLAALGMVRPTERSEIVRGLQVKISDYCELKDLYFPTDDNMSPVLEPVIFKFLSQLEKPEIEIYDEFRHNVFNEPLSVFAPAAPPYYLPEAITGTRPYAIHLPDPGVLMTWEFDSCDIKIAMTDRAWRMAQPEEYFEGFYADSEIYSDWPNTPAWLAPTPKPTPSTGSCS
ncbi:hypothetical protein C8N35_10994 [Breoghania corrubedonensis]|uniref:Uncharacterized protein n=1 Tax=Breoghania corrubedonensis TaxID=665038 RepID=A0A2T5V4Y5_9HYPH|nr:hypothetical protein [Breoghania corrubedonensis]PTW58790.1 hypothetical protein C8N35_10994 [Breoghania corrubedonensis]